MNWLGVAWQWLSDNGGGVVTLAAISMAVVAILALQRTAADSRERSRPYVLAELALPADSDSTIDIVIRNAGLSVARDVVVRFDPELVVPDDGKRYVTEYTTRRYAKPIPTLAPGQRLSNIWWSDDTAPGSTSPVNMEPTPEVCAVTIEYRDDRRRRYRDVFSLVVDTMLMTTYATESTSTKGRLQQIAKSLGSLADDVHKATRRPAS